jgi:LDH2 family malate/lactate/ureidoglycolate dehydrogenase
MVRIKEVHLRELTETIFKNIGAPEDEAKIVSDVLVDTSLHGVDSHGVRQIPRYVAGINAGTLVPGTPIKILLNTQTTAMWDAGLGFGFVAGYKAMKTAVEKGKK